MNRVAWLGLLLPLLVASPADAVTLRPFGGPVLSAQAPVTAEDVQLEFRYAFYLVEPAAAYVQNVPSPYNAAFRDGWQTEVRLVSDNERTIGVLDGDSSLELGELSAHRSYGLRLLVSIPTNELAQPNRLNLTFALALHGDRCAGCAGSGAAQDESMTVRLSVDVRTDAKPQALGTWQLPAVPFTATAQPGPSAMPGWLLGFAGAALIVVAAVILVARQRRV